MAMRGEGKLWKLHWRAAVPGSGGLGVPGGTSCAEDSILVSVFKDCLGGDDG